MYRFLRGFMRFMTRSYLYGLFRVEGLENVPRHGALVVCPNHFGTLDPPMVPAFLPRLDVWSMAKSEYFRKGWMRWLFTAYHAFPVVRHTADREALRRSFDLLKAGHALVMYPEGTRVEAGVLSSPEPGAGFIAQKAGCPVLPAALTGTRECLPKGKLWPRRVPVRARFGKPFVVLQRRDSGERVSHEEASDAIMLAIAEILPAEKRGRYSDLDGWRRRLAGVTRPV
ncbi:MAG: 1-acyl-sn-glycerol-3-phosphate acyltransferase [Chloroflexi bacterium]|nr:MAG: 1-acyl-sn-glycerol-3-phosphate acyltransferase [Chloroflexota bacterium]TMF39221.1 MAG: 1-acyl-sn-glycerol-3-phosphate acyltransferase [Chloroflexota bacterium]